MREVTEEDFRKDEFKGVKVKDYEFREDGAIVKKSRWEDGIRSIRSALSLSESTRAEFEISEVVEDVRSLKIFNDLVKDRVDKCCGDDTDCASLFQGNVMDYKKIDIKYYIESVDISTDEFHYIALCRTHSGIQVNKEVKDIENDILAKCDEISKAVFELRDMLKK